MIFQSLFVNNFNNDNIVLVIHCYITNEQFKTKVIYYLTNPVPQETESGLTGLFWFKISHDGCKRKAVGWAVKSHD